MERDESISTKDEKGKAKVDFTCFCYIISKHLSNYVAPPYFYFPNGFVRQCQRSTCIGWAHGVEVNK